MENPRKRTTVATAAGGDGLHVFDHQQQQAYALNTTSASQRLLRPGAKSGMSMRKRSFQFSVPSLTSLGSIR